MSDCWVLSGPLDPTRTGLVEFYLAGDRVAHRVVIQDGDRRLQWDSVEGDDQQNWPPSPALQSVSIEPIEGRNVALLVGMAGKSHWSMSVDIDPTRRSIRFDVACRISTVAESLGSTYRGSRTSPSCFVGSSTGGRVVDTTEGWRIEPTQIPTPRTTVRWVYEFGVDAS
jgi:hypothetical protein